MLETYVDFSAAIQFQYVLDGIWGLMLAVSNRESEGVFDTNEREVEEGREITQPHWLLFDLWWYPSLALFNFDGLANRQYEGRRLPYKFGQFIDDVFGSTVQDWWMWYSLRRLLDEALRVDVWLELFVEFSWEEYCSLDMYVRMHSGRTSMPPQESWYLLNVDLPPLQRRVVWPHQWYTMRSFKSYGQRAVVLDWVLAAHNDNEASEAAEDW